MSSLGLLGYHSVQFYTFSLPSTVAWHVEKLGFREVARSSPALEKRHGMRSVVLSGSQGVAWIFTEPLHASSQAARYLAHHPDGCAYLNFRVKDIKKTLAFLAERKAPILHDIISDQCLNGGSWHEIAIATAIGDVSFRFVEEKNYSLFAPDFLWVHREHLYAPNALGLDLGIDHATSNARSMHSITEFYRHCLGFEPYWGIEFHTHHHKPDMGTGSGLESIVMWDKESGIKFATNQPLAPFFEHSQIQLFVDDHGGPGVQHIALGTKNILTTMDKMRSMHVQFLEASDKYYEQLPKRMEEMQLTRIREPMDKIQKHSVLLDGSPVNKYLLQIFMKEQCVQLGDRRYGPFFYEIIQREGDESFGEGNFKALFDSIEKQQVHDARQSGSSIDRSSRFA